jgi:hypothetical protein
VDGRHLIVALAIALMTSPAAIGLAHRSSRSEGGRQAATPEARLKQLGLTLPPAAKPIASYVPAVRSGNLVFLAAPVRWPTGSRPSRGRSAPS